jgi:hypothetical protein
VTCGEVVAQKVMQEALRMKRNTTMTRKMRGVRMERGTCTINVLECEALASKLLKYCLS